MTEAYCGPAPSPQALLSAWNADATALFLCAALAAAFHADSSACGDGAGPQ